MCLFFCCLGGGACFFFFFFCGLGPGRVFFLFFGGCVFFFCCLGGGFFLCVCVFAVWAGGVFFFLLFGRGTGVHSLTRLPGSSLSYPTTKETEQQQKNTGSRLKIFQAEGEVCVHKKVAQGGPDADV